MLNTILFLAITVLPVQDWTIIEARGGSDGAGLCVNACIETLARYQGVDVLHGFHEWSKKYTGGSYPEKLNSQLRRFCLDTKADVPLHLSSENLSWERIAAAANDGFPCMIGVNGTLPQYGTSVCTAVILIKTKGRMAWIIDPNFPTYGPFTVSVAELEVGYKKSKWVVFLSKSVQDSTKLQSVLNRKDGE